MKKNLTPLFKQCSAWCIGTHIFAFAHLVSHLQMPKHHNPWKQDILCSLLLLKFSCVFSSNPGDPKFRKPCRSVKKRRPAYNLGALYRGLLGATAVPQTLW